MSADLTRLGAALADRYRIERELGAGGMATVCLAHDLRHEREVAVKVLHPDLAAALGGERFLAEIKTTARLSHPHILPLLDSGAADGFLYYVMPYVAGETLRARLERERQLPMDDALRIAREVADALGAAHEHGIIHRDIKPENILLQGGHALVADFGIALAVQSAGGARMTQTGLSLGTPQYMSPEQAMGERTIDARADQYALGAVTYEMLGGEPPFTGPTVQAIIAKALSERPVPLHTLRDTVPPSIEQAVLRALSKLPADRYGSVRDFAQALASDGATRDAEWRATSAARESARASASETAGARTLHRWSLLAAAGLLVVGSLGGWLLGRAGVRDDASERTATRFVLESRPGERTAITVTKAFALSPDGSTLVFSALRTGSPQQLYRRRLNELDAEAIPGTLGAANPVFSPDGKWIAHFDGSRLVKLPIEGGTAIPLTTVDGAIVRGLTWTDSGKLLYATNASTTLTVVSQDGGAASHVFSAPGRTGLRWPVAIPGTDDVLFEWFSPAGDTVMVKVGSLKDGATHDIGTDAYHALGVVDGYLVYLTRAGEVMAVQYDVRARRTSGAARSVASGVQMSTGIGVGFAVLSRSGDLVYRDGSTASQLIYADRDGRLRVASPDTLGFENPRFSRDGRRIALSVTAANRKDLYLIDRASGILTRFSDEDVGATFDRPEWTPDGKSLLYRRNAPEGNRVMVRPSDLSGPEVRLRTPDVAVNEVVVSPDGEKILGRIAAGAAISQNLWWWTFSDTTPHPVTSSSEFETGARISPDGKWVAYTSETGGSRDVYVAPFPGPGGRIRVSREGAGLPVWGPDSHTLYFPHDRRLMVATLTFAPSISVVSTRLVLEGEYALDDPLHAPFDVGPDGTLLLVRPLREPRAIVIRDFAAEMRRQLAKQGAR